MENSKVTNTENRVKGNPLLGLMDALNIEAAEQRGQVEVVNSDQLPAKGRGTDMREAYEKAGIRVLGPTKGDSLFYDVILPAGWKKRQEWRKVPLDQRRTQSLCKSHPLVERF